MVVLAIITTFAAPRSKLRQRILAALYAVFFYSGVKGLIIALSDDFFGLSPIQFIVLLGMTSLLGFGLYRILLGEAAKRYFR